MTTPIDLPAARRIADDPNHDIAGIARGLIRELADDVERLRKEREGFDASITQANQIAYKRFEEFRAEYARAESAESELEAFARRVKLWAEARELALKSAEAALKVAQARVEELEANLAVTFAAVQVFERGAEVARAQVAELIAQFATGKYYSAYAEGAAAERAAIVADLRSVPRPDMEADYISVEAELRHAWADRYEAGDHLAPDKEQG